MQVEAPNALHTQKILSFTRTTTCHSLHIGGDSDGRPLDYGPKNLESSEHQLMMPAMSGPSLSSSRLNSRRPLDGKYRRTFIRFHATILFLLVKENPTYPIDGAFHSSTLSWMPTWMDWLIQGVQKALGPPPISMSSISHGNPNLKWHKASVWEVNCDNWSPERKPGSETDFDQSVIPWTMPKKWRVLRQQTKCYGFRRSQKRMILAAS
jgi:hypothetical protein